MSRTLLPLHRHPLVRCYSLDEAACLQASINTPVKVERLARRQSFAWEANRMVLGDVAFTASRFRGSLRASALVPSPLFSLTVPSCTGGSALIDGRTAPLAPARSAVMYSPFVPAEFVLDSGYEGRVVSFPSRTAETLLDAWTGCARSEPLRFDLSINLERGSAAAVLRLLEFILKEADQPASAVDSPLIGNRLAEAMVFAILSEIPNNHSRLMAPPSERVSEPSYVRRAEDYMQANAHRHVGLAELTEVTGMSARTLNAAFRTYRQSSPMSFLRARRFELARRLLSTSPETTVTQVALACGFSHLGRFSTGYRARFGEAASATLRRGRELSAPRRGR